MLENKKEKIVSIVINDPDGIGYLCWQPPKAFTERLDELLSFMDEEERKSCIEDIKRLISRFLFILKGALNLPDKEIPYAISLFDKYLKKLCEDFLKIVKQNEGNDL